MVAGKRDGDSTSESFRREMHFRPRRETDCGLGPAANGVDLDFPGRANVPRYGCRGLKPVEIVCKEPPSNARIFTCLADEKMNFLA